MQPGGVPIWVSGRVNERVARRLARFGSGWIPWGEDAGDPAASIPRMREAVAAAGGEGGCHPGRRHPSGRAAEKTAASISTPRWQRVAQLVAAGVTDFRAYVPVPSEYDAAVDHLRGIADVFHSATR